MVRVPTNRVSTHPGEMLLEEDLYHAQKSEAGSLKTIRPYQAAGH